MSDLTLQINLSAGDVAYADLMVRSLITAHRSSVAKTMAVVDCCRPQRTRIVDPDSRFPRGAFESRVERICAIAEELRVNGVLDDVYYLKPDDPLIERLYARYTNSWIRRTHDYGGCGFVSYFAGLELPETRFVIHYDADILLHQPPGYDWAVEAREYLLRDERLVAASPRIAPPVASALDKLMLTHSPLARTPAPGGWHDPWYSTRCFLMDRERLARYLPLVRGRTLIEHLALRCLNRGYPRSPEILMFRTIGQYGGGRRLVLRNERVWMIHPDKKSPRYVELLPRILDHVRRGKVPEAQCGYPEVDLAAWETFLDRDTSQSATQAHSPA